MVWHIRGKRILSDSEARSEDALSWFEGTWMAPALVAFAVTFPTIWWATGDVGIGMLAGIGLGVLNIFFPAVGVWCLVWAIGFVLWKLLPPYWNWGAAVLVGIGGWRAMR